MSDTRPLIITGGPRTGTTLTMSYLQASGLVIGKGAERSPLKEGAIRDKFYKPVLKQGGFDPLAQSTLPPPCWTPVGRDLTQDRKLILDLFEWPDGGTSFEVEWGFKAIKGLLFWPYLQHLFPQGVKWLIVHREIESWIGSLMRTGFMNAYKDSEGWRCYCERIQLRQNALIDMAQMYGEKNEVRTFFPRCFKEPAQDRNIMLQELCEYANLPFNPKVADKVFDNTKYISA